MYLQTLIEMGKKVIIAKLGTDLCLLSFSLINKQETAILRSKHEISLFIQKPVTRSNVQDLIVSMISNLSRD